MAYHALTIAGSDSSGGAGIQADLKTFSALGVYGASVITALTAQSPQRVAGVMPIAADFVRQQLDVVLEDLPLNSIKIGMVADPEVAHIIHQRLRHRNDLFVVLDPVMVAKNGARLVDDQALAAVRDYLLPIADLVTPNLPEAGVLLGRDYPRDAEAAMTLLPELKALGAGAVLLKGGHLEGATCPDWLDRGHGPECFEAPRVNTSHLHGTGCTLSSAIAALYPQIQALDQAIEEAKTWLGGALQQANALHLVEKGGPVHHFHQWWPR